ncbi:SAM-dependent methyltransferase [Streptomyces sp. NPDC021356]|uniref:SAM-dependent methyltransferase n=1 Tax=Streptomyces sp. NPDC021356 TaxID=3154900 RepID=UPI0033D97617
MVDALTAEVTFAGAGPGAADLLTFRAARAIAGADVVTQAAGLARADALGHAREGADTVDVAATPVPPGEEVCESGRHGAAPAVLPPAARSGRRVPEPLGNCPARGALRARGASS